MENYAIHESKKSDKVVKFVAERNLTAYCSNAYARKIIEANNSGLLEGLYFTESGKIRANFR